MLILKKTPQIPIRLINIIKHTEALSILSLIQPLILGIVHLNIILRLVKEEPCLQMGPIVWLAMHLPTKNVHSRGIYLMLVQVLLIQEVVQ